MEKLIPSPLYIPFKISNAKGYPEVCLDNVCTLLEHDPSLKGRLSYDEFTKRIILDGKPMEENDITSLRREIDRCKGMLNKIDKGLAKDAIVSVAMGNTFDSAVDVFESLKWDGEPRLDTWLTKVVGEDVPNPSFVDIVGRNMVLAIAKLQWKSGAVSEEDKFPYVVTLLGPQGLGKTSLTRTLLRSFGSNVVVDAEDDLSDRDARLSMAIGTMVVNFDDGNGHNKKENKSIRKFVTKAEDRVRPMYAETFKDYKRRFIIVMSENEHDILQDEWGNRRYLIVDCKKHFNFDWLNLWADQVVAEAWARRAEPYEAIPKELQEVINDNHLNRNSISDKIARAVVDSTEYRTDPTAFFITLDEAMDIAAPNRSTGLPKKSEEMYLASEMRKVGLDSRRVMRNGIRESEWFATAKFIKNYPPKPILQYDTTELSPVQGHFGGDGAALQIEDNF